MLIACGAAQRRRAEERRVRELVARHIHVTHSRDTNTTSSSALTHAHPREMDVVNATGGLVTKM